MVPHESRISLLPEHVDGHIRHHKHQHHPVWRWYESRPSGDTKINQKWPNNNQMETSSSQTRTSPKTAARGCGRGRRREPARGSPSLQREELERPGGARGQPALGGGPGGRRDSRCAHGQEPAGAAPREAGQRGAGCGCWRGGAVEEAAGDGG
jgi:hypothetical protein